MTAPADELMGVALRCEAASGPDGELDMLIWAALNDVTNITYPGQAEEFSRSGRVEGIDTDGRHILLGWIDPGQIQRNWTPYGGDNAYPAYTASLDAAMTLVPEGAMRRSGDSAIGLMGTFFCDIVREDGKYFHAIGYNEPCAIVAAALKARASAAGGK